LKKVLNITNNGKGGLSSILWKMRALEEQNKSLKTKNRLYA
jgi:hypothetical protein